jgi:hypothetical protein
MATCKDCIHYEVCDYHITEMTPMTVNECSHSFKNKDNFVEVVRCKDCKHCELCYPAKAIGEEALESWYCKIKKNYMLLNDFCSYGEKR